MELLFLTGKALLLIILLVAAVIVLCFWVGIWAALIEIMIEPLFDAFPQLDEEKVSLLISIVLTLLEIAGVVGLIVGPK